MINHNPILHSALTAGLIRYFSERPLYKFCTEQLADAFDLIDQCCVRVQAGDIDSDLSRMCIQTTRHEEVIFQYASTDDKARLAHWVRQYSKCHSVSDREAHAGYVLACAVKALEALDDWMRKTDQEAWSHVDPPSDWPWELYCQFVESQIDPHERTCALDQFVLHLEPITTLPCLIDDELRPAAEQAIKNAILSKGGINSGIERSKDVSDRDAAIVRQGRHYFLNGMGDRHIASAVHAWLKREVAKPPEQRADWVTPETEKALSRKRVEAILERNFIL